MGRQSSAPGAQPEHQAAKDRPALARWGGFAALAVMVALVLAGCGEQQPFTTITPQTDKASEIQWLYTIVFWASLVVFIAVQFGIVYVVLRFRRRSNQRPEQVHGNTRLEIAWTIIPAVILLVIYIPTARVIFDHAAAEDEADFVVNVYGKQWWWEFDYPEIPADPDNPDAGNLVTANEVRIPEGANVVFNLQSNNVIHSFWVPQLSGKLDVMPGHRNQLQFTANTVGEYFGECAEFCGAAHAWMRFKVLVVPEGEFDAWVEAWRTPPSYDADPDDEAGVAQVPPAFGVCLACHQINGTNATIAPQGFGTNPVPDTGNPGPNLTLLACRDTIGAGILVNNEENLRRWLTHTDEVKQGVYMPNYYAAGQLSDEQVDELVEYLMSLQPEDGCPPRPPVGGDAATPVAVAQQN
jgi:cytochrome c oxidase subunit 2